MILTRSDLRELTGRKARKLLGHELESTTAGYTGRRRVVKITPN